jgi:hypothetical protein
MIQHRADRPGLLDRLGQHASSSAANRYGVHMLRKHEQMLSFPGNRRYVYVLRIEDDGNPVLMAQSVCFSRQSHSLGAVDVAFQSDLEHGSLEASVFMHQDTRPASSR